MCGQRFRGSLPMSGIHLYPVSCGGQCASSGTDVTRAIQGAGPPSDRIERAWVPKRETSRCAARRRGSGMAQRRQVRSRRRGDSTRGEPGR